MSDWNEMYFEEQDDEAERYANELYHRWDEEWRQANSNEAEARAEADDAYDCAVSGHVWTDGPEGKSFVCVVCGVTR